MAEVKIRKLDDGVARALRTRARERGVSLGEEARRTLSESVAKKLDAFARRAAASRAATRRPKGKHASDSSHTQGPGCVGASPSSTRILARD